MLFTQEESYYQGDTKLIGYIAYPKNLTAKSPAILVVHDWTGRHTMTQQKADALAQLGYVAFAVDMYGEGKTGESKEEKYALMQPLMEDRALLQKRILAAFDFIKSHEKVDATKIGAIGFCFGGLCALDLARSGADVKGVVSFHGLLNAPTETPNNPIKASILVLHGYDDPMVTPADVIIFANEMTASKAHWEIDMYGHTMHAFTNPQANDPSFGTVYNKQIAEISWTRMTAFFARVFK